MEHINTEYDLKCSINNLVQYINGTYEHEEQLHYGLCENVLRENLDVFTLIMSWEENDSGYTCFPIECDADAYYANYKKHDRSTEYGKKRLRLAKYLLINLQKELELH
jgi:hypothetical protein